MITQFKYYNNMLTTNQLIKIFSKSEKKDYIPETEDISEIIPHVYVESGVLENGIDYFFRIKLIDLSKSEIPDDTIFKMAKNGWVLSKDRKYVEFLY